MPSELGANNRRRDRDPCAAAAADVRHLMRNDEMMLGADRALDDFRPLRDAMRDLADTLADPGLSSEQYFRLTDQWEHHSPE